MLNTVVDQPTETIHVAVGIIYHENHDILITKRPEHVHQGGLWEFPGGKVEAGETVELALARELMEEVGIQVISAQPLIKINHDYGDKSVLLDVWQILNYSGKPQACEAQAMQWVSREKLHNYCFPTANLPIIKALQLPVYYPILDGPSITEVLNNFKKLQQLGISLLQLRIKSLPPEHVKQIATQVLAECRSQQISVLINSDLKLGDITADGIHLSSRRLLACQSRPSDYRWVAASCHNLAELQHAERIGVDFAVLATVQATASHPGQKPLGWNKATYLINQVNIPIYALGGLQRNDLNKALQAGAQGIAGISTFLV